MEVSVVIPFKNDLALLKRALNSIYRQTHLPSEVILVNDHSDFEFFEAFKEDILKPCTPIKINLIVNQEHGISSALNTGVSAAKGTWISFLDADDIYYPNRIQSLIEASLQNRGCKFLFTDFDFLNTDGTNASILTTDRIQDFKDYSNLRNICKSLDASEALKHGHIVRSMSNVFVDRNLIKKLNGFNDLTLFLDYDFCLRALCHTKLHWLRKKQLGITLRKDGYSTKSRGEYTWELIQIKSNFLREKLMCSRRKLQVEL